jgi:hypothetical protein
MDDLAQRVDAGFGRVDRDMTAGFERVDREMTAGFERVDRDMTTGFARTDREMNALSHRMNAGFERVDRDIRDLRTDISQLRTEMMRFGAGILVALLVAVVTPFFGG